jgi:hypothetical protein
MENQSGEVKKLNELKGNQIGGLLSQLIKEVEEYEENTDTDYKELTDEEKIEEEYYLNKFRKWFL